MSKLPLCTLEQCPPGLFLFQRGDYTTLGFKSEYMTAKTDGGYQCDAYVVSSGEYFWGGATNSDERNRLMVTPLDADAMCDDYTAIFSKFAYAPRGDNDRFYPT